MNEIRFYHEDMKWWQIIGVTCVLLYGCVYLAAEWGIKKLDKNGKLIKENK